MYTNNKCTIMYKCIIMFTIFIDYLGLSITPGSYVSYQGLQSDIVNLLLYICTWKMYMEKVLGAIINEVKPK